MDFTELVHLLSATASQDVRAVREAEDILKKCSEVTGFYVQIARVCVSLECPEVVRFQASLYLKNSIDRIWRKSRSTSEIAVSDDEKASIRQIVSGCLMEPSDQLSVQHAVIVTKVARLDCPASWPELIPLLAETLETSESGSLKYRRALGLLYRVVKMMASKRLALDRRRFQGLTKLVFLPVCKLLETHLGSFQSATPHRAACIKTCLKCIRYMVLYGEKHLTDSPAAVQLMGNLPKIFNHIMLAAETTADSVEQTNLSSSAVQISKMFRGILDMTPLDLVDWLQDVLSLSLHCTVSEERAITKKLRVTSMNNIKMVFLCQDYKILREDSAEKNSQRACAVLKSFFTEEVLRLLCGKLVEKMVLEEEDCHLWLSDPEAYDLSTVEAEAWEHELRPCAESLLSAVVHEHWERLTPLVKDWVGLLDEPLSFQDEEGTLKRDAILSCLGLVSQDFQDTLDSRALFRNLVLSPSVWIPNPPLGCKILQRRLVWLTERWIVVKLDKDLRPDLYGLLGNILNSSDCDMAVKLAACSTLKQDKLLGIITRGLMNVLESCSEDDARMKVVWCLILLSERCGREWKWDLEPVLNYVPRLWNTDHHTLKSGMLSLFSQVVKSGGREWSGMEAGLCGVVEVSVNGQVSLLEDSLELWLTMVEQSVPPLSEGLLRLFSSMPPLIQRIQSEHLKMCLEIVVSYALFRSDHFAQLYGADLFGAIAAILPDLRSEAAVVTLKTSCMLLRCIGKDVLPLSKKLLLWVHDSCASTTTESTAVSLWCLCVIWDACLLCPSVVRTLVENRSVSSENPGKEFLDEWLRKTGHASCGLEQKKRSGLALSALLSSDHQFVLSSGCFPDVIALLVECIPELCAKSDQEEEGPSYVDVILNSEKRREKLSEEEASEERTEQDSRMKSAKELDPVFSVPYLSALCEALRNFVKAVPPDSFEAIWQTVDIEHRRRLDTIKL